MSTCCAAPDVRPVSAWWALGARLKPGARFQRFSRSHTVITAFVCACQRLHGNTRPPAAEARDREIDSITPRENA